MDFKNLQELTKQDMGIVVYDDDKQVIVCNWAQVCPDGGLPIFGHDRQCLRPCKKEERLVITGKRCIDTFNHELPQPMDLYDINGDLQKILSGAEPQKSMEYIVKCSNLTAKIIAPVAWKN